MNLSACSRVFFLLLLNSLLLMSCAVHTSRQPDATNEAMNITDRQYMCVSKIYLSDLTKAFLLPVDSRHKGDNIQVGKILDKAVQNMFWTDSSAALSGRALPAITLGFDGGTGVYNDSGSNKYLAQISLQFQVFKPTGQSYMDVVVGQSSGPASGQAASEAAINAAIMQALHRLGSALVNAQICRVVQ
jgi:hypothetical protein